MRILHLPINIASQISVTVRALRDIGINARGISLNNALICDDKGIDTFEIQNQKKISFGSIIKTVFSWKDILLAIRWADIVHWYFGTRSMQLDLALKYLTLSNKPRVVEFWGSDIRIPEIASEDNPYIAGMYKRFGVNESQSYVKSIEVQSKFSRYGFECFIPMHEFSAYLNKKFFPNPIQTRQRVLLKDYEPIYPDPSSDCPLIVHTPSDKGVKGTEHVLKTIELLKEAYNFNFKLVHNVPRNEALNIVRNCDIMIDQVVIGEYGLSSIEAMALGKPTVCYIKQSLIDKYPSNIPIINANQDNLMEKLSKFIENAQFRNKIGQKSREYVENYHDAHKFAHELARIYENLLNKK